MQGKSKALPPDVFVVQTDHMSSLGVAVSDIAIKGQNDRVLLPLKEDTHLFGRG